ncbi:homeobox protein Mohawk-like [Branchiostoma floridae]|uniref:Homeobox protein Mohawk-like n=1 Tax=Branchiostoma floridae TaxID=7739 RepID=A0A9J7HPM7_BRAFL|nr:homeobox protein Mohawk-like [Branchiostoma floridae]XP_035662100.1 homeobox protein Mohawk-like [Branchiostoma floridae]
MVDCTTENELTIVSDSSSEFSEDDLEYGGGGADGVLKVSSMTSKDLEERDRSLRRRSSRRRNSDRVRHKRQVMQDMARPLKQWLIKHRDNPYPTKTEKILLALTSQMTLVQVSNWFANARRRLKNTVRDPDLSWGMRIKLYNKHVQGNAELLSISSGDDSDEDDFGDSDYGDHDGGSKGNLIIPHFKGDRDENSNNSSLPPSPTEDLDHRYAIPRYPDSGEEPSSPTKYKHSILQRYLNDSFHSTARRNDKSGSLSSQDYEDLSESARSFRSSFGSDGSVRLSPTSEGEPRSSPVFEDEELHWKEIDAAMALTSLARSRGCP